MPESLWWMRMLSIASSPLLSPLLGTKTHFSEFGLRDAGPAHLATRGPPFFSRPSCASSTLGRDLEVRQRRHLVPIALRRSSSFWRGTSLGYVCNPSSSRERDAASRGHTSSIPASGCFISWSWRRFHRTCFYASWPIMSPARDVSPILWTGYTCDSEGVPIALRRSVSFPRGTRVTYVT